MTSGDREHEVWGENLNLPLSLLWSALRRRDQPLACSLVRDHLQDPNQWGPYDGAPGGGGPALGYALWWGMEDVVDCLLDAGALTTDEHYGDPLLGLARSERSLRRMVHAGADINAMHPPTKTSVLMALARRGDPDLIVTALELGADINHRDFRRATVLFDAGSVRVAEVLIAAGCDPLARNDVGSQALFSAVIMGKVDLCRRLIELGCDPSNIENHPRPRSLVEYANQWGYPEIAALLEDAIDDKDDAN